MHNHQTNQNYNTDRANQHQPKDYSIFDRIALVFLCDKTLEMPFFNIGAESNEFYFTIFLLYLIKNLNELPNNKKQK